jgi:hypothetical protein
MLITRKPKVYGGLINKDGVKKLGGGALDQSCESPN